MYGTHDKANISSQFFVLSDKITSSVQANRKRTPPRLDSRRQRA